jgi:hypothetical protein
MAKTKEEQQVVKKVRITFSEPLLGTLAGNKDIATDFIASKHPDGVQQDEAEAIEGIDESLEKASTIFWRDNGRAFLWDYQFKGFFKESCLTMIYTDTMTKEELKAVRLTEYLYKRTIDKLIHVFPRKIFLHVPDKQAKPVECERSLRAKTMRGERVALARSEELPAGTYVDIEILVRNKNLEPFINPWLDEGALIGMGQWRTGGKGRFKWELIEG